MTNADFSEHKDKLFKMYQNCRYNEIACVALMRGNMRTEKWVRYSTVAAIGASLITGTFSFAQKPELAPIWGIITVAATVIAIWSLILGSSSKQFHWFSVSTRLRSKANDVEFFSELVRRGRIAEGELLEQWRAFTRAIEEILEQAGSELRDFISRNQAWLDAELQRILGSERKL